MLFKACHAMLFPTISCLFSSYQLSAILTHQLVDQEVIKLPVLSHCSISILVGFQLKRFYFCRFSINLRQQEQSWPNTYQTCIGIYSYLGSNIVTRTHTSALT